jgi:16S rRNA (adenine1518-N6/adenine1519-N6)-dimethyltransferase
VQPLAEETDDFRRVVKAAFQSRRKTLRNALALVCEPGMAERALQRAGIEAERRGETLSVDEFASLGQALELER